MANKDNAKGAKLIGSLESSTFNAVTNRYVIPATDSNIVFKSDFVKTNNTSENGIPICLQAAAGEESRGIIVAFETSLDYENQSYRSASTRRIAYVADNPYIVFEMQANAAITSTDIGKNFDIIVAAGSTITGISGTQLDVSSATTGAAQVKLLSIIEEEENEVGEFAKVRCMFVEHELAVTGASGTVKHNELLNRTYDTAGHGTGKTGFQRGTTLSASDPTANDDDTQGYVKGDFWLNTTASTAFVCVDNSTGVAVWHKLEHSIEDIWERNASTNTVTLANAGDTVDLGTGNIKFTTGATINEYSIDGTLAGNSDTALPTEKGAKTYIDAHDLNVVSVFNVVAAVGITPINGTAKHIVIPIQSSTAGAVDITAVPQIAAGFDGQLLTLIGQDDTKTVQIDDGDGFALDGGTSFTFGSNDTWHGSSLNSIWVELSRRDN